jgi:hypothetical protein
VRREVCSSSEQTAMRGLCAMPSRNDTIGMIKVLILLQSPKGNAKIPCMNETISLIRHCYPEKSAMFVCYV